MSRRHLGEHAVRFILVGIFNTVFGFGLYWVFLLGLSGLRFGYLLSLLLSWSISITVAFVLYRRFVFFVRGNAVLDFIRFISVYIVGFIVNSAGLALMVEVVGISPLLAQLMMLTVTTLGTYAGHRWFSFRRPQDVRDLTRPDDDSVPELSTESTEPR